MPINYVPINWGRVPAPPNTPDPYEIFTGVMQGLQAMRQNQMLNEQNRFKLDAMRREEQARKQLVGVPPDQIIDRAIQVHTQQGNIGAVQELMKMKNDRAEAMRKEQMMIPEMIGKMRGLPKQSKALFAQIMAPKLGKSPQELESMMVEPEPQEPIIKPMGNGFYGIFENGKWTVKPGTGQARSPELQQQMLDVAQAQAGLSQAGAEMGAQRNFGYSQKAASLKELNDLTTNLVANGITPPPEVINERNRIISEPPEGNVMVDPNLRDKVRNIVQNEAVTKNLPLSQLEALNYAVQTGKEVKPDKSTRLTALQKNISMYAPEEFQGDNFINAPPTVKQEANRKFLEATRGEKPITEGTQEFMRDGLETVKTLDRLESKNLERLTGPSDSLETLINTKLGTEKERAEIRAEVTRLQGMYKRMYFGLRLESGEYAMLENIIASPDSWYKMNANELFAQFKVLKRMVSESLRRTGKMLNTPRSGASDFIEQELAPTASSTPNPFNKFFGK